MESNSYVAHTARPLFSFFASPDASLHEKTPHGRRRLRTADRSPQNVVQLVVVCSIGVAEIELPGPGGARRCCRVALLQADAPPFRSLVRPNPLAGNTL